MSKKGDFKLFQVQLRSEHLEDFENYLRMERIIEPTTTKGKLLNEIFQAFFSQEENKKQCNDGRELYEKFSKKEEKIF